MTLRLRTLTGALMAAVLLSGCGGMKERGHSTFHVSVVHRCVRGGYERKLRDVREERERREMRSVDFYLVTPVSLVLLVLPHRPC
jgi:hypothetical protein